MSASSISDCIIAESTLNREARLAQLKMHCAETSCALTTDQWAELVQLTEGYSGSDIANLVLGALFEPIRHMQLASHWIHTAGGSRGVWVTWVRASDESECSCNITRILVKGEKC